MASLRIMAAGIAAKYRASHPHWIGVDSPLKYVDWAFQETVRKSLILVQELRPKIGGRLFEFGPGTGYFLHFCQQYFDCDVSGCDVPERPLYKEMQAALGITTVVDETICPRHKVAALDGKYDLLVGTQISWMDSWDAGDLDYFLADAFEHLHAGGRIVLFPNPAAFRGADPAAMFADYRPQYVRLPWLNQGVIL